MQHRTKSLNKFGSGKNAPASPCQHTLLSSSARNASFASESTSAISRQVPRELNASSKDRLGRQEAYQGEGVACLGKAHACPAVAEGGKTCLSLKARAIHARKNQNATAPPFATQLRRRLKLENPSRSRSMDVIRPSIRRYIVHRHTFLLSECRNWTPCTSDLYACAWALHAGSLLKMERILLISFVG